LLALIHYHLGRNEKSQELLKKQYNEATRNPGHKSYVLALSERLSISIQ